MPLVSTSQLVTDAVAARRAVLAFNVVDLEQAEGVVAGAEAAGCGVVLAISENAVWFHGGRVRPLAAACREVVEAATVPMSLHFDHVMDEGLLAAAAGAGFSSVMVDASQHEYADNVRLTAEWTTRFHDLGISVEAELGEIGGKDGAHAPGVRTDPDDAAAFVAATGVDGLAVAVGSSHAMHERTAQLDHELIARLREAVPVPLVLHGSSGVPPEELRAAVAAGMTKINVGTLLGKAFTGAVRTHLEANPTVVDPRKYLTPARTAVADAVRRTLADLGLSSSDNA